MTTTINANSHKSLIRNKVWSRLRAVALPDSRFHHDYSSFIADFEGSSAATDLLQSLPAYQNAHLIFIAPDNCLQELRYRSLTDGKKVIVTTYGIRRGFWILDPEQIHESQWQMASVLDGMENIGRHMTLADISELPTDIALMVTGTGAINLKGLRFGKGHGYFDLEWAMLYSIGKANQRTQTIAVVHECQVLDEELRGEVWDTGCDFVVTNDKVINVKDASKPSCGILWDKLEDGMLEDIEPLKELEAIKKRSRAG
ncbi:5-formyltetrahydrofolate cyclo-ligase [Mollisia scopiformis]|uniref:5-formyltetrahydrofolate cyclo-ligase n=1 Tax=Mollisia scopiformis TaxID=149040 RepID=A0A194X5N7_MOLSC|nr:5-formyltetrahydrofolate cyclo-ligase [Mollisia scopiformis]KUJ15112.1 5-formyltetrahydrofolate cyclo-ligase [Mollisia scopiformis]